MAPHRWTDADDKEVLMAIMKLSGSFPKFKSQDVADLMNNKVTGYAIEHRLRALRKEFDLDGKGEGAPKTPAKTPAKKGTPRGSTAKRKAKQEVASDDDEEQIEKAEEETPSKKKSRTQATEVKTAVEGKTDEDDDSEWHL